MHFSIGDDIYLDGTIQANGNDAADSSDAGGGSGGSILINCGRFSGHGRLAVDGGSGNGSNSGGGSGGRIAVYTGTPTKYLGEYSAIGGSAGDSTKETTDFSGGPGTVYLQDVRNGYPFTQLRIDNKYRPWSHYVTLEQSRYEFDELYLSRNAAIRLSPDNSRRRMTIHKINGDRTGLIHVHSNQSISVEYKESIQTITRYFYE